MVRLSCQQQSRLFLFSCRKLGHDVITPDQIRDAWGWTGLRPKDVIETNAFGNMIVKDDHGTYWRICPEDLSCTVIATTDEDFCRLRDDPVFVRNWDVSLWVEAARARLGDIPPERTYCLKVPAPLGGRYESANFGTISRLELLSASGDMARQIHDLPDGAQVELRLSN